MWITYLKYYEKIKFTYNYDFGEFKFDIFSK
jgi:hypothetical protein